MELEMQAAVNGVQQLLDMGGNGAAILICYFLYKLEKRVHTLEIIAGVRVLRPPKAD